LGDWFPLRNYFLSSKASPNGSEIVIVIIIDVIGEAQFVLHMGGIIAQTVYFDSVFLAQTKIVSRMQSYPRTIKNQRGMAM
jgi:hypothetical protein